MKNLKKYFWTISFNLFQTFVIFLILNNFYESSNSFELCVIAILTVIYIFLRNFALTWTNLKIKETIGFYEDFKRIRVLLKEKVDYDENEYDDEVIEKEKNNAEVFQKKIYINTIFTIINYIIALFSILVCF